MEEQGNPITKETPAEARKRQRNVQRQKNDGKYEPTLLERAKDDLRCMDDPSIESLMKNEAYQVEMDEDTVRKLKVFIQNIKAKTRKNQLTLESHSIKDEEFKEKVKSFVNRKIDKLHQAILIQQTEEDRASVILDAIDKNLFDFLEYMDNYPAPSHDFLRIIIGLRDKLDEDSFTGLFVRVCSKNGGDPLIVTPIMVERAIRFLVDVETNQQAAYGLLRLVFINQISLSKFDVDLLMAFHQLYAHAIIRFFKSIGIKDDEIIPLLPATCFLFTTPMLGALKQGGSSLHYRLPPTLLPYLLEIISYSFCEDQQQFDSFLEAMRQGCKRHSHRLIKSDFTLLLKALTQYTCQRRKEYFKGLKQHEQAIQKAFILLEERRVEQFTEEAIENLLSGGDEGFQVMKQRPKILSSRSADELKELSQEILSINQQQSIDFSFLDAKLQANEIPVFKALGIANLLPIQNITFQLCTNLATNQKWFLQYQTGQGKTALCLAIACFLAQCSRRVIILNESRDLTFRDFKKAQNIQDSLGIRFSHGLSSYEQKQTPLCICFCTFEDLLQPVIPEVDFNIDSTTFVIDEFDSIIFEKRYPLPEIIKEFNRAEQIIAFTGSIMQDCHKAFIQNKLQGNLVNLIPRTQLRTEAQCRNQLLFSTKKELKAAVVEECSNTSLTVPIVLVCEETVQEIKRSLAQKSLPIESLFEQTIAATESSIQTFIIRRNERFPIYIVNQQQGRGMDFPSSSEIEACGGVHVLIVGLPKFYLQLRQFIGRTARIGNKGTYSIFEQDKDAKNSSAEVFFKNKIEELKNNAIIDLSINANQNSLKILALLEEEKSSVPLAGIKRKHGDSGIGEDEIISQKENKQSASNISTVTVTSSEQENDNVLIEKKLCSQNSQLNGHQINSVAPKRVDKNAQKQDRKTSRQLIKDHGELSEVDKLYFKSYEGKEIHEEMLNDEARVDAYRQALSSLSEEKVVIDVGAGTGILSTIAMDYGASCVYAIEKSLISKTAEENFSQRKDKHRMAVHCCLAEDFSLGKSKADLIVSEWMGYFLIYENMLPSVLAVRDKCLKKDGEIIPREASLFIAGYEGEVKRNEQQSQDGIEKEYTEAFVGECMGIQIATRRECILKLFLPTVQNFHNEFKATVKLEAVKTTELSGLCSWFNCLLAPGVVLDTSPFSKQTHWQQTLLPFKNKININKGDIIQVDVHARPQVENHRALDITIITSGEALQTELIQEFKLN